MKYKNLRDFLELLEKQGELKRITQEIDPYLEMTEIADRTLRAGGPALLLKIQKAMKFLCFVIYLVLPNVLLLEWGRKMLPHCVM